MAKERVAFLLVLIAFILFGGATAGENQGGFSKDSKVIVVGDGQNFTRENSLTFDKGVFSFNNGEITFTLSKQVSAVGGNVNISAINPKDISHKIENKTNYYQFDANIAIPPQLRNQLSQIALSINSKKPIERFSETAYRIGNYVIDFSDAVNAHNAGKESPEVLSEKKEGSVSPPVIATDQSKNNVKLLDEGKIVFNDAAGKSVFSIDPTIVIIADITEDTTWYSGNTYFVTVIVNVKNGATLTIQPGTIIKFKGSTYISVTDNGKIVAKGAAENKIHFTSCKDQSIGEDLSAEIGCDGNPQAGDYVNAIFYQRNQGIPTLDSNNLADLNISFGQGGIRINTQGYRAITLNSIHDCNFQNLGSGRGIYFKSDCYKSVIVDVYNNTFTNIKNADTYANGGAIELSCSQIVNIYGNIFADNEVNQLSADGGAIHAGSNYAIRSIYNNIFTNNKASWGGAIFLEQTLRNTLIFKNTFIDNYARSAGGAVTGGPPKAIYDNNFTNNSADQGGAIYIISTGTVDEIYNNFFTNNTATNGGAIYVYGNAINVYNNIFAGNSAKYGGAIYHVKYYGGGTITNLYNNTFSNTQSAAVYNSSGSITNLYNNIFALNDIAIYNRTSDGTISNLNNNAYWQNDVNCSGVPCGENDVEFTAPPFLSNNSNKNFLIVPSQVSIARNAGTNIGNDNFFNTKTIGVDNEPDTGTRDIGYHYQIDLCDDRIKDGDETDIDCGGTCQKCEERKNCLQNSDCLSNHCNELYDLCDVPGDLYIEWIKPIQVVEGAPLVAGKATVVRVKVVNNGPETTTDVALNYGNGCYTETRQNVTIRAFSSQIIDFYPTNNCTQ